MQIGVLSVKDSNQFLSLALLQSLRAMVTNSMNLINDDDNPLWDRFSISAVPTLIAFDKGKIISRRDTKMGVGLNESDLNSLFSEII